MGSTLAAAKIFKSDLLAFCATIPFNLYAILTILMVIILACTNISYGPMRKIEKYAELNNELGALTINEETDETEGKVKDLLIPIIALIVFSILAMLYTGGLFSGKAGGIISAFGNSEAPKSLALGGFGAIVVTFILYMPRKILSFKDFMGSFTEGIKMMVPAITILVLAWTISGVCRDLLSTGQYIGNLVQHSHFPVIFLPLIVFIVASFLSFSMGTAWGTFGILIPIVIIICEPIIATNPSIMIVTLAATLGGSVFGDHCSPISDTTILSSTGADCNHIQHVSTQIPYALTVAAASGIGYFVSALTKFNVFTTIGSGVLSLIVMIYIFDKISKRKNA